MRETILAWCVLWIAVLLVGGCNTTKITQETPACSASAKAAGGGGGAGNAEGGGGEGAPGSAEASGACTAGKTVIE